MWLVPKLWEETIRRDAGWAPTEQRVTDTADRNDRLKMTTSQGGAWGRYIFKSSLGASGLIKKLRRRRRRGNTGERGWKDWPERQEGNPGASGASFRKGVVTMSTLLQGHVGRGEEGTSGISTRGGWGSARTCTR